MKLHAPEMFASVSDGHGLRAQQCADCGKMAFPCKRVCPACFGEDLDERVLGTSGTLHTWTETHLGAPHLPSPYLLGFVDLPEGIRLMSLLVDCDPWEEVLRVELPMEMTMRPLMKDANGEDLYTYMFTPAKNAGGAV